MPALPEGRAALRALILAERAAHASVLESERSAHAAAVTERDQLVEREGELIVGNALRFAAEVRAAQLGATSR